MMIRMAALSALVMTLPLPALAEQADEARQHFNEARRLEARGDLSEALSEYERAYELRPTYRLHRYMGQVCQRLGRYTDAIEHFEQFLADGGGSVQVTRRREVEQALAEVRQHVGALRIEGPDGAMVSIDGVPVGRTPLGRAITVNEGRRELDVRLEGHRDHREELDVVGGEEHTVTVSLEAVEAAEEEAVEPREQAEQAPPSAPEDEGRRRVHRAWFWSGLALSLAALSGGAALGGLALGEQSTFDELNVPARSDEDETQLDEAQRCGEAMSLASDVLLFTGAAFAVTTLILAFFTDFRRDDAQVQASIVPSRRGGVFTLGFQRSF